MRFLIRGIDRQTGQALTPIIVEASCERDALEEATRQGMLTEAVEVYEPPSPSPPVPPPAPGGVRFVEPATSFATNILVGVMLFGAGILLFLFCFWPVGVVCMLAGIIAPFYGMAVGTLRGPCPYCGHEVFVGADRPGVNCPACKKRIVVRDRGFVRID